MRREGISYKQIVAALALFGAVFSWGSYERTPFLSYPTPKLTICLIPSLFRYTSEKPLCKRSFKAVAQVGRSWNPIVLELQEWLKFGKEVGMARRSASAVA